jgi:hypothetical protein
MSAELNAFREGFCKQAAELGMLPSELLNFVELTSKQAEGGIITSTLQSAGSGLKDLAIALPGWYLTAGLLSGAAGIGAGGLAAYLSNKGQEEMDPDNILLREELPKDDEMKRLHLIAKYRQASKELNHP